MLGSGLELNLEQRRPIPMQIQLQVRAGELVALVGPSGSGKTTILRAIAGLNTPRQGRICCDDHVWLDTRQAVRRPPQARRVGMVFQDYALFPHLSAEDNLILAMDAGSREQRRDRARELLALVRLEGLGHRHPGELSGGQQQRVAVARALARDPRVLLLDEPFSAVDMMTRRRLQRELAILRQNIDIPIILVTHDLDEATALADRICVLQHGTALQTDEPGKLFRQPRTSRVARLLGRSNVFAGRIEHLEGQEFLVWGERRLELAQPSGLPDATRVDWYIPDSDIVLHRRGRPSLGERENPMAGTVEECVSLGAQTSVTLREVFTGDCLQLTLPTHAARRNGLEAGVEASVSLLAEGWSYPVLVDRFRFEFQGSFSIFPLVIDV